MGSCEILGSNLKKVRKANGLSQADISKLLKVTIQTVIRWEAGNNWPPKEVIDWYCETFSVLFEDLAKSDLAAKPQPQHQPITLKKAAEIVSQYSGDIVIKVRPKQSSK